MATYTNQIGDLTNFGLEVGDVLEYTYTGTNPSITLPKGLYQLECWGGKGGNAIIHDLNTGKGGNGGYAIGKFFSNKEQLYLLCGGAGTYSEAYFSKSGVGGYNGGVDGGYEGGNGTCCGGSGGATHIGLKEGLLTTFESDYVNNLLIVAGGGGAGSITKNSGIAYPADGGTGGGITGGNGTTARDTYAGSGGTQTEGGYYTIGSTKGGYGSFGQGGHSNGGIPYINGGGGGLYGGGSGSGYSAAGGGGSGYVNPNFLTETSMSNGVNDGNGKITITYLSIGKTYTNQTGDLTQLGLQAGDVLKYTYTGTNPSITLPKGSYQLECYGGAGSSRGSGVVGLGGYSTGNFKASSISTLYLASGGKGSYSTSYNIVFTGGYNGGGDGYVPAQSSGGTGGAGGGATHIALVEGLLNSLESQKDQVIIVAGGGGGASRSTSSIGGSGGGITGGNATQGGTNQSYNATGGTQTAGGLGDGTGSFGKGSSNSNTSGSCGGGGGWYGGGSALTNPTYPNGAGGGGSGYVSSTYLTDAFTENGLNNGDGYIQITVLNVSVPNRYFIKVDDVWQELEVE